MIYYFVDAFEGDAVVVEPKGRFGILAKVIDIGSFGEDEELGMEWTARTKREWKEYWKQKHDVDIGDFDRVFRVIFPVVGLEEKAFDYPESAIRKVIPRGLLANHRRTVAD